MEKKNTNYKVQRNISSGEFQEKEFKLRMLENIIKEYQKRRLTKAEHKVLDEANK